MALALIFRAWIALATGLIAGAWVCSAIEELGIMKLLGPAWLLAVVVWATLRLRAAEISEWIRLRHFLLFWPFLLLLVLIIAAGAIYPPTVFDSLAYRLPRIFIWLQENKVMHVPVSDERLNCLAHNWELFALPWVANLGDRVAVVQNIASWVVLYLACAGFSMRYCRNQNLQPWVALSGVVGFFPVLQASSTVNDLFPVVFVTLSAWFFLEGRDQKSAADIMWSGLSLALAAGTKPHFSVLALFWLLGLVFFFPWRELWLDLLKRGVTVLPIALLVSPLPLFALNYVHYDKSLMGPLEESDMSEGSPDKKIQAAFLMAAWGNLQPPINPWAQCLSASIKAASDDWTLRKEVPKFGLSQSEIPLVDGAGLGLFASLLWIIGWFLAWRHHKSIPLEVWCLAAVGVMAFATASSVVIAATLTRSFMAMLYLTMPLAMAGLAYCRASLLKTVSIIATFSAAVVLVLTPTAPLWPAKSVAVWLKQNKPSYKAESAVLRYASFTDRYYAGEDLIKQVPASSSIIAVMGGGEPLVQLWKPYSGERRVEFLKPGETLDDERFFGADYVITGGIAFQLHELTLTDLEAGKLPFQKISEHEYTSRLQDGVRVWKLYKRNKL